MTDPEVLGRVGAGARDGCAFGTPDGPCPNPPTTTVAAAARHRDGVARWLVPAWTPACRYHGDALAARLGTEVAAPDLWRERGGTVDDHPAVVDPDRARLARWLAGADDRVWSAELSR